MTSAIAAGDSCGRSAGATSVATSDVAFRRPTTWLTAALTPAGSASRTTVAPASPRDVGCLAIGSDHDDSRQHRLTGHERVQHVFQHDPGESRAFGRAQHRRQTLLRDRERLDRNNRPDDRAHDAAFSAHASERRPPRFVRSTSPANPSTAAASRLRSLRSSHQRRGGQNRHVDRARIAGVGGIDDQPVDQPVVVRRNRPIDGLSRRAPP